MTSTFYPFDSNESEPDDQQIVSIGRPINNAKAYILDNDGLPVPMGCVGLLYLSGPGVARGYLNLPEMTQRQFVNKIIGPSTNTRLYQTGDLVSYRADGNLIYHGRIDNQLKIRGFRVELGEIENQLMTFATIDNAVVVAQQIDEQTQLVAYITCQQSLSQSGSQTQLLSQLEAHCVTCLPDYMRPSAYYYLDEMPLTANGKVDRKGLLDNSIDVLKGQYVAPSNEFELKIAVIWSQLLKIEQETLSVNADFFAIGGHSLLAIMVVAEIRDCFAVELAINEIFQLTTIQKLAAFVGAKVAQNTAEQQLADSQIMSEGEL